MGMKLYYKIIHGYEEGRFTPLEAEELEKAYGLFLLGGRAVFKQGAVDSKYIQAIQPDWNRIMGWAQEYTLGADDYNELSDKGIDRAARELQARTQEKVQYLIQSGQEKLIGTNTSLPELEKPQVERNTGGIKKIGEIS